MSVELKKKSWKKVLIAALVLFAVFIGAYTYDIYSTMKEQKEYEELQKQMVAARAPRLDEVLSKNFVAHNGEQVLMPSEFFRDPNEIWAENAGVDVSNPIDFKQLQELNQDLYAWIRITDTNIDYPIAQHAEQDDFYLNHNIYGEPQFSGSIYSEAMKKKDFSDPVTVLYGHNMRNGTMFQNLHLFENKDFFDTNPYVYVYTPDGTLIYEIVSAGVTDNRHILYAYDFSDEDVFAEYLKNMKENPDEDVHVRDSVELTIDSRILIMSTCVGNNPAERYIVQAVKVYDGRKTENG